MRKRLAELNGKIRRKLEELDDDRQEREQANQAVHRKRVSVRKAEGHLRRARRRVARRRRVIEELRADLDEVEGTEEQEIRERLDQLSGQLEEAIAVRDRWLDRLDRRRDLFGRAKRALRKAVAESQEDREALERMRARRQRIRDARKRRDRPSPSFDWAEFDCNDGTEIPERSKPAVKHWCETIGEPMRERFGSVHINSGFRHAAYNHRIGGETNSVHIYDFPGRDCRAVAGDFTCARGSPRDWFNATAHTADGRGVYRTFHHADSRGRIGWPDATWSG